MYRLPLGVGPHALFISHSLEALLGGILIGLAVTLMLLFNGRVTGISGIIFGAVDPTKVGDRNWRVVFLMGLFAGGLLLQFGAPSMLWDRLALPGLQVFSGGLLVGFGTLLGNGCTSGHGVCGISRLSLRSITATATFMLFGFLAVYVLRHSGAFS